MKFLKEEDSGHSLIQQLNKMKLIGFIKEHNSIKEAVSLDDLFTSTSESNDNVEGIIKYLNSGVLLMGWMGYFIDVKTKKLIAPDSYFTDGRWVWPSYLPYYLEMYPSMKIDPDFLAHLKNRNFELMVDERFKSQKNMLEKELSERLNTES